MKKEFDVIVVGGGINGLTCATYLQKAGLEVALVERRNECGGLCRKRTAFWPGGRP